MTTKWERDWGEMGDKDCSWWNASEMNIQLHFQINQLEENQQITKKRKRIIHENDEKSQESSISNSKQQSSWGTRFESIPSLVEPCPQLQVEAISRLFSFFLSKESDEASGIVFVFKARAESEYSLGFISGRWFGGINWGTRLIYLDFSNLTWKFSTQHQIPFEFQRKSNTVAGKQPSFTGIEERFPFPMRRLLIGGRFLRSTFNFRGYEGVFSIYFPRFFRSGPMISLQSVIHQFECEISNGRFRAKWTDLIPKKWRSFSE